MNTHADHTANNAIGAVNREWQRMLRLAIRYCTCPTGLPVGTERRFTGIYHCLLTDTIEELRRSCQRKKQSRHEPVLTLL